MGYKIRHYAQPVTTNVSSILEVIAIEFSVWLICAGMAYWARDIEIRLAIGCLPVAIICLFLTLHNLYLVLKILRQRRKQKIASEEFEDQ